MRKIPFLLLLFISQLGIGQSISKTQNGITTTVDGLTVEVQFFSPQIVRVIKAPEGTSFIKQSLSVIKKPQAVTLDIQQQSNAVMLKSEALQVALNVQTGKVAFYNISGQQLFTEKDYGTQFTSIKDVDKNAYIVRQAFRLDKDEVIYGLGQQQNGKLNQRGQKVFLRQDNMKVCIPFFQSTKGYGLFWDNYAPTTFIDNLK
jgi:alpha-D-xyloside xylohydrolase